MATEKTNGTNLSRLQKALRRSGFTLAELIVVITILAILAVIGFIALSWYSKDAKDSAVKANVRSLYTAITAESAVTGNSPRFYIVHDSSATGAALSGAIVYFQGTTPTVLTGGNWNEPNTNYSAGNPDYVKLKLNKDKFRVSDASKAFWTDASAAVDANYVIVGAADATITSGGKTRTTSYVQVAGTPSTGTAVVTGNFTISATAPSGGSTGLIRDMSPSNTTLTGALMDGGSVTVPAGGSSGGWSTCVFDNPASTFDNCTFGA